MESVFRRPGGGGCRGFHQVEVRRGGIRRRIAIDDFVVPEIQLIGPRAQPIVFRHGGALGIAGAGAWRRALRGKSRRGQEHIGRPAGCHAATRAIDDGTVTRAPTAPACSH